MTYNARAGSRVQPLSEIADRTFDDVLGQSGDRYLSDGYRRVVRQYQCTVTAEESAGRLRVSGAASLSYPTDWSTRQSQTAAPPPHFSSVDAALLTERIAAGIVAGTAPSAHASVALTRISLHAGTRAGTVLTDIPVEGEITGVGSNDSPAMTTRFGDMKVTATVNVREGCGGHPVSPAPQPVVHDPMPIAGSVESSALGPRWTSRVQRISDTGHRIEAVHSPSSSEDMPPALSVVDLLRLSAQQAQILIYRRDGLERDSANLLWMRQAHFAIGEPRRQRSAQFALQLDIVRDRTLARGGALWRLFDVVATDGDGVEASASLAYLRSPD